MNPACVNPVVHLELRTGNLPRECAFYTRLFGWRAERIDIDCGSYLTLGLGNGIEGGVVEGDLERSLWLPYVEVADVAEATRAHVCSEPRSCSAPGGPGGLEKHRRSARRRRGRVVAAEGLRRWLASRTGAVPHFCSHAKHERSSAEGEGFEPSRRLHV